MGVGWFGDPDLFSPCVLYTISGIHFDRVRRAFMPKYIANSDLKNMAEGNHVKDEFTVGK